MLFRSVGGGQKPGLLVSGGGSCRVADDVQDSGATDGHVQDFIAEGDVRALFGLGDLHRRMVVRVVKLGAGRRDEQKGSDRKQGSCGEGEPEARGHFAVLQRVAEVGCFQEENVPSASVGTIVDRSGEKFVHGILEK